jgi:hypothetical protein
MHPGHQVFKWIKCWKVILEIKKLLKRMPKPNNISEEMMMEFAKRQIPRVKAEFEKQKEDPATMQMIKAIRSKVPQKTAYIGRNGRWLTVLSEDFSFETIQERALSLSRQSSRLFLAFAVFDDDVFILSLIKDGKELTRSVSGRGILRLEIMYGFPRIIAEALTCQGGSVLQAILKRMTQSVSPGTGAYMGIKLWIPLQVLKTIVNRIEWTTVNISSCKVSHPCLCSPERETVFVPWHECNYNDLLFMEVITFSSCFDVRPSER